MKKVKFQQEKTNPSFSSTLLDEIYRSIDDLDNKNESMSFHRETKVMKKQSNNDDTNRNRSFDQGDDFSTLQRSNFMDKKVSDKMVSRRRQISPQLDRKWKNENDALFFSSSSCCSDSISGGFSSSETETFSQTKFKASCYANPASNPKAIRTKQIKKETEQVPINNLEEKDGILKLKLSAMKIYRNMKKMKQPISPGARLSTFINSLFNDNHKKKSKISPSMKDFENFDKLGTVKTPMCSSATSYSRSCLSKDSNCAREFLRKSVEKTVKFDPVSVIVDQKCSKPIAHKSVYDRKSNQIPTPILSKSNNLPKIRAEKEVKFQLIETSTKTEQYTNDVLKQHIINQRKIEVIKSDFQANYRKMGNGNEDDDASDSSSDLFELDNIAFSGKNHRYCEELPLYETTRLFINHAIW